MDPVPPIPTAIGPLLLDILLVLTVVSALFIFGMALREVGVRYRRRERLFCPVRQRMARVVFGTWPDGEPADVIRCSVFGRRPITCGKACLHHRVAA